MAKKAVGKVKSHEAGKMAKVIRAVRAARSGAYTFKEAMVPTDQVAAFLKQQA